VHGVDTYDYQNRLVRRDNGTNVIQIAYDGDGNLVSKSVISGGTTNRVWYLGMVVVNRFVHSEA